MASAQDEQELAGAMNTIWCGEWRYSKDYRRKGQRGNRRERRKTGGNVQSGCNRILKSDLTDNLYQFDREYNSMRKIPE
jgi:hypothetical protein